MSTATYWQNRGERAGEISGERPPRRREQDAARKQADAHRIDLFSCVALFS
jgi:hypothetical protein